MIYRRHGAPPSLFQTVLWPLRPGQDALPHTESIGAAGYGWVRVGLPGGRVDLYCDAGMPGRHEHGDVAFDGPVDFSQKLAARAEVKECMALSWFRFAYGRGEGPADACTIQSVQRRFATAKYDLRELLAILTQTDAFQYRRIDAP